MQPDPSSTVGPMLAAVIREVSADVVRVELEPLRRQLDALAAATPPTLVDVAEAARRLGKSTARIRAMAAPAPNGGGG